MADYYSILPIALGLLALILSLFFYKKNKDHNTSEIMSLIRSIISYNSHELAQYNFLALEHYKRLKNELLAMRGNGANAIKRELDSHIKYLTDALQKVALYNFEYLERYFSGRGKTVPRITLRLFKNGRYLSTIATNSEHNNINDCYEVDKNTAFLYVVNTGKYFLSNNLSNTANYLSEEVLLYKSTAVIPLVLVSNALDESFSQMLNIDNIEKTLFGVLTVDYKIKGYFNEEDIGVLSIVSELLTNFLVVYSMYTEFSRTYHESVELIGDKSANKGFQPTLVTSRG